MKKLLFIFFLILILQGSFSLFAVSKKSFADLLLIEKNDGVIWLDNSKFLNDSSAALKINEITVADPDLTFNVALPATPKYKPNGEIDYYSICKASSSDLTSRPFIIVPLNSKPEYTYSIDWGDGSAPFSGKYTAGNPFRHDFLNSVNGEFWRITYKITYEDKEYVAFYNLYVGSTPELDIRIPPSIKLCVNEPYAFKLENRVSNSIDTKYSFQFNDGTPKKDSTALPSELIHSFKKTSCGVNSVVGTTPRPNSYSLTITAENKCGITSITIAGIYVSQQPEIMLSQEPLVKCELEEFQISGIVVRGVSPSDNSTQLGVCQQTGTSYWEIVDETGKIVTFDKSVLDLIFGNFGNNNGFPNYSDFLNWTQGTPDIRVKFFKPGVYYARLNAGNHCGGAVVPQTIIINPIITPVIKIEEDSINCSYLKFKLSNFTNKTTLNKQEQILKTTVSSNVVQNFTWEISKDGVLIESLNQSYSNNKFTPEFIEKQYSGGTSSGSYQVRLRFTGNSCNSIVDVKKFEVPGDTKIQINKMDACLKGDSVIIHPSANINTYGVPINSYYWSVINENGDTIHRSNVISPNFSFYFVGKYNAILKVSTSCGTTSAKLPFVIEPEPEILPVSDLTVCENQVVTTIPFTVKDASQGVRWVNSNPTIGLAASGTATNGNEFLPSFTAINPGVTAITATITVFPQNIGCQGEPISFKITVNPSKDTAPHNKQIICAGDNLITLKAKYNAIDNNPHANYQWYMTDGIRPQIIPGATSWEFNPDNIIWGTYLYYCRITPKCDDLTKPCCSPFDTNKDTITILPKPIIKDTLITIAKSLVPYNFTPINGVNNNIIPTGTMYKWKVTQPNPDITGATDTTVFVDEFIQLLNLSSNFSGAYAEIVYTVTAITETENADSLYCETTYNLTVRVVPGITATVICNPILCFGGTASIVIRDIFGIMQGNTIVRLLDVNNNDNIIDERIINIDNIVFGNLYQGNYKVSIVDENGINYPYIHICSFVEPTLLLFDEDKTKAYDVKCKGESNGEIYISNVGGTPNQNGNYGYLWEKLNVISGNYEAYSRYSDPKHLTGLTTGTYRVTVKDENQCSVTKVFVISEPSELFFTATGSPVLNCDDNPNRGGSILITSPGGGIVNPGSKYFFTWTKKNQTNESSKFDLAGINSELSNIQEGVYVISIYDDNGCSVKSPDVKIDRAPALIASIDSLLVFDCETHRIFKQYSVISSGGVGNHTVKWFDGLTELAIGNSYVPDNLLNGKLITVRITDERACVFTLTVTPFTLHLPVFDFKTKKTACNKYQFEAISPENVLGIQHSFKWNFSGQDSGQGKATEYDLDNLQVNSAGEYYVELIVLDNFTPCEYPVVRKTFKKNFIPDMKISSTGTVETVNNKITVWYCEGDTITVFGENANAYSWSNGSSKNNIKINHEGQFTLWGKNSDGCEGELNFETRFYKFGYEIVTDKDEINLGETVAFSTATFVPFTINYLWNFGDGTMNSTIELPYEHTYHFFSQDYFDILLTATNPKGCKEYATKRIKVNISSFPNTIMPGSIYEENRVFMKGCQVQIYNRNSVLIHEGADGWDGTHNGKPVMSDTYFYVLTYTQATGVQQTKKGYVTVIR